MHRSVAVAFTLVGLALFSYAPGVALPVQAQSSGSSADQVSVFDLRSRDTNISQAVRVGRLRAHRVDVGIVAHDFRDGFEPAVAPVRRGQHKVAQ